MPGWSEILGKFVALQGDAAKGAFLDNELNSSVERVSARLDERLVILMGTAFLVKPEVPSFTLQITREDLDGFMAVLHGADCSKGLALILHTPGGQANATETIVAYLRSKFSEIDAIVPTFAMSAGTLMALASDRVYMGRQSQLGPIDPQLSVGGKSLSAKAVVEQFGLARNEILGDPSTGSAGDINAAHLWAPVLATIGPSLLQEARDALDYSEGMAAKWLAAHMLAGEADPVASGKEVAAYFNDATIHKSHGRRIDRAEAASKGIRTVDLEGDQDLQDDVMTAYHCMQISFLNTPIVKMIVGSNQQRWFKYWDPKGVDLSRLAKASGSPAAGKPAITPRPRRQRR